MAVALVCAAGVCGTGSALAVRHSLSSPPPCAQESAILYNHDNEFLHYQDDWYVLAFKEKVHARSAPHAHRHYRHACTHIIHEHS